MINVTCADLACGVAFGIPEHIEVQARRNPTRVVVCPNGHRYHYADSEPEALLRKLASRDETIKFLNSQRDRLDRVIVSLRGRNTRLRNLLSAAQSSKSKRVTAEPKEKAR